jgi:hypothetical protein
LVASISAAGKASFSITEYTPSYASGWEDYGGSYARGRYWKTSDGFVHVEGLIRQTAAKTYGAASGDSTIFTLPVGFRPANEHHIVCLYGSGQSLYGTVNVTSAGRVFAHSMDNTAGVQSPSWISLCFSFKAA